MLIKIFHIGSAGRWDVLIVWFSVHPLRPAHFVSYDLHGHGEIERVVLRITRDIDQRIAQIQFRIFQARPLRAENERDGFGAAAFDNGRRTFPRIQLGPAQAPAPRTGADHESAILNRVDQPVRVRPGSRIVVGRTSILVSSDREGIAPSLDRGIGGMAPDGESIVLSASELVSRGRRETDAPAAEPGEIVEPRSRAFTQTSGTGFLSTESTWPRTVIPSSSSNRPKSPLLLSITCVEATYSRGKIQKTALPPLVTRSRNTPSASVSVWVKEPYSDKSSGSDFE